jgi:hypothetical protein
MGFDDDLIDHRGQLSGGSDPARPGQVGIAHTQRGIPHKLTQDAHGLDTLLREL